MKYIQIEFKQATDGTSSVISQFHEWAEIRYHVLYTKPSPKRIHLMQLDPDMEMNQDGEEELAYQDEDGFWRCQGKCFTDIVFSVQD